MQTVILFTVMSHHRKRNSVKMHHAFSIRTVWCHAFRRVNMWANVHRTIPVGHSIGKIVPFTLAHGWIRATKSIFGSWKPLSPTTIYHHKTSNGVWFKRHINEMLAITPTPKSHIHRLHFHFWSNAIRQAIRFLCWYQRSVWIHCH